MSTAKNPRPTVLVVDDNPDFLHLMDLTLSQAGYRTLLADSAMAAMDRLEAEVPGAILLDIMMPVRSGFEFLENLRWDKRFSQVPVVVITAMTPSEEEREFMAEFAAAQLDKADIPQALEVLKRLLDSGETP